MRLKILFTHATPDFLNLQLLWKSYATFLMRAETRHLAGRTATSEPRWHRFKTYLWSTVKGAVFVKYNVFYVVKHFK